MLAASLGEMAACTIRVPSEIFKQRLQIKQHHRLIHAVHHLWRHEGIFGLYKGYGSTLSREV
jgi:solute carrier family 25 (mitochondrial S-adenosylmethionine transporter), member 26